MSHLTNEPLPNGKGKGLIVARRIFKQFKGVWNVMQIPENKDAAHNNLYKYTHCIVTLTKQ